MDKQLMENPLYHGKDLLLREYLSIKNETTVKDFKSKLSEIKRLPPDGIGKMLPGFCDV